MYLIVGLGNPGSAYKYTRHNAGFRVIDLWSRGLGVRLTGRSFRAVNVRTVFHGQDMMLFKPAGFMNLSGKSVKSCVDTFRVETGKILVVHDDLDLPVGRIKVVRNGGAGGHKGVLSIIDSLGSKGFARTKIGVGRPEFGEYPDAYVLNPFYPNQLKILENVLRVGVRACELFVSEGVESAMNHINCQNLADKEE
ncbi:MAG: aminoacyl-tRNA hydrolase [Desulfatiglandaceae bacterium]